MSTGTISRRKLIERGAVLAPVLMLAPFFARRAFAAACADPDDSLRASLHYVEQSGDAQKTCSACGFFSEEGENGCGSCKIFNGPANPKGHCDSWAAKG